MRPTAKKACLNSRAGLRTPMSNLGLLSIQRDRRMRCDDERQKPIKLLVTWHVDAGPPRSLAIDKSQFLPERSCFLP